MSKPIGSMHAVKRLIAMVSIAVAGAVGLLALVDLSAAHAAPALNGHRAAAFALGAPAPCARRDLLSDSPGTRAVCPI